MQSDAERAARAEENLARMDRVKDGRLLPREIIEISDEAYEFLRRGLIDRSLRCLMTLKNSLSGEDWLGLWRAVIRPELIRQQHELDGRDESEVHPEERANMGNAWKGFNELFGVDR